MGGQQTGNAICILALNMINDKVGFFCSKKTNNKQINQQTNK